MEPARLVARRLPQEPGVYRFRDENGRVLYIGRAVNLRRRVLSYWTHLGDRPRLRRMVTRIARVESVWCDSEHEAAWLERNLLEHSKPRWNRVRGGAEVVGYIRFDPAGPRFTHTVTPTAPHFGPYLGGLRVRQAISALQRVIPLHYTADTGGSLREFARLFGVSPDDRVALTEAAYAVLEREPAAVTAVRAELVRRRDAASTALRFEFAAKLQEELAAFEWIMAEQKVAQMVADDIDVYGWANGVLVGFTLRGGRVRTWTQQAMTERTAHDRVAATPASWQLFAQRNAELAARLLA
ncbi:GIY-YIG nuclease family protein [Kribbella sandramycini]|uniref:Excinuclease ABC subunit C n=1 Tax=Kribbella sandramycini TaxID=60450 RepID=A0A7Y4L234_9ACTN|nr:GIY-YIG nuclease family protein [Kribbella sandramycini]MBB6566442.1 excinuclease ABC subunit C [Kribbella sandramycini]NOL42899.1 GIY-YIG nuclease family protein [Kribbella sandramycini]